MLQSLALLGTKIDGSVGVRNGDGESGSVGESGGVTARVTVGTVGQKLTICET